MLMLFRYVLLVSLYYSAMSTVMNLVFVSLTLSSNLEFWDTMLLLGQVAHIPGALFFDVDGISDQTTNVRCSILLVSYVWSCV